MRRMCRSYVKECCHDPAPALTTKNQARKEAAETRTPSITCNVSSTER
jgi:hypothetical protein